MSEQLLDLLRLCLLALLYLFFLRVMWAVWTEVRTPEPAVAGPRRASSPKPASGRSGRRRTRPAAASPSLHHLAVIEPPERVGETFALAPEMTLGRSPGCTIVVDDTYVSQLHARVFAAGDEYRVEDMGSTNGTLHNGASLTAPKPLRRGDHIQVGNTLLELT